MSNQQFDQQKFDVAREAQRPAVQSEPVPRPSLGVIPRRYWLADRAKDLSRAIHAQLSQGADGMVNLMLVTEWIDELRNVVNAIAGEVTG